MTEVQILNDLLKKEGLAITGEVIYRLVWSNRIFEHRHGLFRDYVEGTNILIREVTETRYVRKYNYIDQRWILEKWAPGELTANKETPDAMNGDYLPVYVFEDKNGKYLPPTEKVLLFILNNLKGQVKQDERPSEEYLEEKELQYELDQLNNVPEFSTSGPSRNSIAYTKGLKNVPD